MPNGLFEYLGVDVAASRRSEHTSAANLDFIALECGVTPRKRTSASERAVRQVPKSETASAHSCALLNRMVLHRRGDGAQICGHSRILIGKQVQVADFDVGRHDAGPFGARAKEPPSTPDQPRGVKSIARNQELDVLAAA